MRSLRIKKTKKVFTIIQTYFSPFFGPNFWKKITFSTKKGTVKLGKKSLDFTKWSLHDFKIPQI